MKKEKISLLLILALSVIMISACIEKPESVVIGKWKEVNGTVTIEFFKDGTVTFADSKGAISRISGDYKFIDDNHIRIDFGGWGASVFEITITKNELILTMHDGEVSKYQRIK